LKDVDKRNNCSILPLHNQRYKRHQPLKAAESNDYTIIVLEGKKLANGACRHANSNNHLAACWT
jgi:hypothetical protein